MNTFLLKWSEFIEQFAIDNWKAKKKQCIFLQASSGNYGKSILMYIHTSKELPGEVYKYRGSADSRLDAPKCKLNNNAPQRKCQGETYTQTDSKGEVDIDMEKIQGLVMKTSRMQMNKRQPTYICYTQANTCKSSFIINILGRKIKAANEIKRKNQAKSQS